MKLLTALSLLLAALMLLCLAPMPYGYYTVVRLVAVGMFAYMAYDFYCKHRVPLIIVSVVLLLLFQPFVKVPMDKVTWNIVDVVVAVYLIVLSAMYKRISKSEGNS